MNEMFSELENLRGNSTIKIFFIVLVMIFLSGILFAFIYFFVSSIQTQLEGVNCDIPNNVYYSNCQELFGGTFYKVLNLKSILKVFSYIFIFSLVTGLLVMGYVKGQNPVTIGVIFVMTLIFTYGGILVSNLYRQMLENQIFYNIMLEFSIYNKIMLNFPWFIGFIGLLSMTLGLVNFQKARVNTINSDLDY